MSAPNERRATPPDVPEQPADEAVWTVRDRVGDDFVALLRVLFGDDAAEPQFPDGGDAA